MKEISNFQRLQDAHWGKLAELPHSDPDNSHNGTVPTAINAAAAAMMQAACHA